MPNPAKDPDMWSSTDSQELYRYGEGGENSSADEDSSLNEENSSSSKDESRDIDEESEAERENADEQESEDEQGDETEQLTTAKLWEIVQESQIRHMDGYWTESSRSSKDNHDGSESERESDAEKESTDEQGDGGEQGSSDKQLCEGGRKSEANHRGYFWADSESCNEESEEGEEEREEEEDSAFGINYFEEDEEDQKSNDDTSEDEKDNAFDLKEIQINPYDVDDYESINKSSKASNPVHDSVHKDFLELLCEVQQFKDVKGSKRHWAPGVQKPFTKQIDEVRMIS